MTLVGDLHIFDSENNQMFVIKWHQTNHSGERQYILLVAKGNGLTYSKASNNLLSTNSNPDPICYAQNENTRQKLKE